jgi:hypothetical protein
MGYSWPCYKRDGRSLSLTSSRFFCACLATGYVPATWHQVKVVSIPKSGRTPITFLLKTMERLIDRFLRGEILAFMPLHPKQHAYQAGKSVETALHQLVVQVKKVTDQKETAVGVFLNTEGAFNTTSYDSICAVLAKHGVGCTII